MIIELKVLAFIILLVLSLKIYNYLLRGDGISYYILGLIYSYIIVLIIALIYIN